MGNHSTVIDLDKELSELFTREELFGFFDIGVPLADDKTVSGLCKISKPKGGASKPKYFSLLFVIDTQDRETWGEVDRYMGRIDWSGFARVSGNVQDALPMLSKSFGSGNYVKEVYIYLQSVSGFSKEYVFNKLFASIPAVTGLEVGSLTFWDDLPETGPQPSAPKSTGKSSGSSLLGKLKDLFNLS
jgi:hypothetical protein